MSGSYREIKVWQKAIELVVDIYACTRAFPREEVYGLGGQGWPGMVGIRLNRGMFRSTPQILTGRLVRT